MIALLCQERNLKPEENTGVIAEIVEASIEAVL
jgi:hypothetical protein